MEHTAFHWKIPEIPGNKWNLALFLVGNFSYKKCVPITGFHELSQSLIWAAILNFWTEKGTNATRRSSRDGHFHQDVQKRLVNGKRPLIWPLNLLLFWRSCCRRRRGLLLGSLSTRDFEDDAAVRSTKAWVWRRRSPAKFNLLSTDAVLTRRLHSQFLIKFCICCAMASFKEFRQTLLLYYDADLITDEDFIILYELFSSRNPDFAYDSYDRFDLDNMNDDECKAEFRVRKRDLPTLAQALRIPRSFQLSQRSVVDGMEGLCMLLKRLSYPCRYGDLIYQFPFLVSHEARFTDRFSA